MRGQSTIDTCIWYYNQFVINYLLGKDDKMNLNEPSWSKFLSNSKLETQIIRLMCPLQQGTCTCNYAFLDVQCGTTKIRMHAKIFVDGVKITVSRVNYFADNYLSIQYAQLMSWINSSTKSTKISFHRSLINHGVSYLRSTFV